ncbi:hypothetical protein FF36_02885 [Frankia torreyi]|uniref:Uncharacterized protein n=1 Tax=Frankia torreyi TaxID=1856 RepID=A0A0D8BF06_9ACTN|nr:MULTISPECIES: hypothetical protein [Frankia]KJE22706.1 hypothetical protein FF36_02885 [Frankia torreyi]KQM04655.1 hypothetical protein FF86_10233 [Frankia sp. CpI1-P]
MSSSPTDPGPDQAPDADRDAAPPPPDAHANAGPKPAEPPRGGSAEPPEAPSGGRPPLRPVDWDGSFTRTWQSRDRNEVMNRLADEHEFESAQRELDQMMREFRDKANEAADARAREKRERAAEQSGPADDARSRLFDKLERFGRPSDDADASPHEDGGGSPDTR